MSTLLVIALLACSGSTRPDGVPADATHVSVSDGQLRVDGTAIAPWAALEEDPTNQLFTPLEGGLTGDGPVWVDLPGDAPWFMARRVIGTARSQGHDELYVSVAGSGEALHPEAPPRYGLAGVCPDGPFEVLGVEPLVTLAPQRGREGAWVLGTARILPVVQLGDKRQPVDGLPAECLRVPSCDALFTDGPLRAACDGGGDDPGARRLRLGGPYGCLLPIAKAPDQIGTWRTELAALAPVLGLDRQDLLMVMPEARTRWGGVLALLGGLRDGGRSIPALGTPLVEGNDGPPVCNATVRTSAQLETAAAAWVGGLAGRATQEPRPAPAPTGGADE